MSWILSYRNSKNEMLDWLESEPKSEILAVINFINEGDDYPYRLCKSGTKNDLVDSLIDVPKSILWDAIDEVFPDAEDTEDEEEFEDEIEYTKKDIIAVIKYINEKDEYNFKLPVTGNKSELFEALSEVPQKIAWKAIDAVFLDDDKAQKPSRKNKGEHDEYNIVHPENISLNSFDLSILNLDQDPHVLLKRIENFYRLSLSHKDINNLSILFSGPSGAGKTHLIKFLTKKLNRSVMLLSASSFLSKWVGETEQNIKKIFEYAEKNNSIVFIDEIEGLLRSRDGAENSWELTQVNELLVRLENFKGVCIGATNLYESLDSAFYRRFTLKVNFDFMKKETRWPYLKEKFKSFLKESNSKEAITRLCRINFLTPGDIESVYRRLVLDDIKYSADQIVNEIEKEISLKKHVFQKKIKLH